MYCSRGAERSRPTFQAASIAWPGGDGIRWSWCPSASRRISRRAGSDDRRRDFPGSSRNQGHSASVPPRFRSLSGTGFAMFGACRFVTGMGIGGEYAAISSRYLQCADSSACARLYRPRHLNWSYWICTACGVRAIEAVLRARAGRAWATTPPHSRPVSPSDARQGWSGGPSGKVSRARSSDWRSRW